MQKTLSTSKKDQLNKEEDDDVGFTDYEEVD